MKYIDITLEFFGKFIHSVAVLVGKIISSLFTLLSTQIEKNKMQTKLQLEQTKDRELKNKYIYFQNGIHSDIFVVLFNRKYSGLDIHSIDEIRPMESENPYHFHFKLPVTGTFRDFQLEGLKTDIQQDIYRFQQKILYDYGADAYSLYPYIMHGLYVVDIKLISQDYFKITLSSNIIY